MNSKFIEVNFNIYRYLIIINLKFWQALLNLNEHIELVIVSCKIKLFEESSYLSLECLCWWLADSDDEDQCVLMSMNWVRVENSHPNQHYHNQVAMKDFFSHQIFFIMKASFIDIFKDLGVTRYKNREKSEEMIQQELFWI